MAFRPGHPSGGSRNRPSSPPPAGGAPAALPAPRAPVDARQQDASWHGGKPPRAGRAKAVALEYRPDQGDPRPRITATGSGAVAEQILQAAFASGVKVREDADLVEILALFEEDSLIPLEALAAVAEILAYVYRAENRAPPAPAAPAAEPWPRPTAPSRPVPERAAGESEMDEW